MIAARITSNLTSPTRLGRAQLEGLVSIADSEVPIRDSYIAVSTGRCKLPPVGYLAFPEADGDCHIKYGHIQGDSSFVIKVATGFYQNPAKGLSSSNGIVLVVSALTGQIEAIFEDEGFLTDLRTGVGVAIATKALSRPDATKVGVIGRGVQARHQIRCLSTLMNDRDLTFTVWGRAVQKLDLFCSDFRAEGIEVVVETDRQKLCETSEIILTATPASSPLVMADWIKPGTHITASGADAPGKQELETKLCARADLLVLDSIDQCLDHGEVATAQSEGLLSPRSYTELGLVLSGATNGRRSDQETTIADLTGLGSQDIAIAQVALTAYRNKTD